MTRATLLRFILTIVLAVSWSITSAQGLLDGRKFVVEEGDPGQPATVKDNVITFADGEFHSQECEKWGYSKGKVKPVQDGDAIRFETELVSERYGRAIWSGEIRADRISGKHIIYFKPTFFRPNPAPVEKWFAGTLAR